MSQTETIEKRVVLGSGDAYVTETETEALDTSDVDALISTYFVPANRFGETKSGGNFSYTPSVYTVESDLGRIQETHLTKEEVKLGFGLCTSGPNTLEKLLPTARIETTTSGKKVVKVGGLTHDTGKTLFVGFKHTNSKKGDIYVMILGKPTGELTFNFNPDTETVINPTFTAQSMDDDGTKFIIVFDKPASETNAPSQTPGSGE